MPKFSNGKMTSNVIFYNRGVPASQQNFAYIASSNFSMLKTINRFNKNGNSNVSDTNKK